MQTFAPRYLHAIASVLGVAMLASCGGGGSVSFGAPVTPPENTTPTLTRSQVLTGLIEPWDLAFLPDGSLLFTERCRGLSIRRGVLVTRVFGSTGALNVAQDFFCLGQSGMLGVAVDPDFNNNRNVYVFMASTLGGATRTNRVVRLTLNSGFTDVVARTDIVTDIPFKNDPDANGAAGTHSGGRIRFGPDGFLYVTTGDNHVGSQPQDLTRLGGKVLRITRDGLPAPTNSVPAGADARIYAFGLRNVQGIAFRPAGQPGAGQAFIAEHGPAYQDEVTPLVGGGNGGWDPQNRPSLNCPNGYCGYAGTPDTMPMTDLTRFPNAMRPSYVLADSQGMGPAEFLSGAQWKAWNGRLAVGIMAGQRIEILSLDDAGTTTASLTADLPPARYRALVQGSDGSLYVATDAGEVVRVTAQ